MKKFQHSALLNILLMGPSAMVRSSNVLAAGALRYAFSFEKAISIGFRSGEYGGRERNYAPISLRHAQL